MGIMAGSTIVLFYRLVNMLPLKQLLCLFMARIAQLSIRQKGHIFVIRGMGAVARQASAFFDRGMDMGLCESRLVFRVAPVTELCPFFFNLQGLG